MLTFWESQVHQLLVLVFSTHKNQMLQVIFIHSVKEVMYVQT